VISGVFAAIGASDCEEVGTGLIAQPFNTWSSLAYVGAGLWIIIRRRTWRLDPSALVFGLLVVATGVGSVAFHAAADATGHWLHDLSLLGALAFVAGWHVALLRREGSHGAGRIATISAVGTLVLMGVVLVPLPDATNAAVALLVAVALLAFVLRRIRTRARPTWSDVPFVAVAALALGAFALGRTGSPVCDEDSAFQFHGLWHIGTAVLAVVWARGALSSRERGEGAARAAVDRFLAGAAGVVVRGFFREVTVEGRERVPTDRAVLLVLNHFNGLVDPIVAIHALGRLPRFMAKATLWKTVPARPFLALAGLIPVYRAQDRATDDRDAGAGNRSAFADCHAVLAKGGTVAIFPEGTTSARSQLAPVKTGAARIALGAVAQGVEDLLIVPVGIAFEDRVAFRGRAFVEVGEPIVMATEVPRMIAGGGSVDEEDRVAVDHLTAEIDAHLRACAPDYETPRQEATLQMAAKVALRPDGPTAREPDFGEVELTARRLTHAPVEARREVESAVADYALDLRLGHLTDAEITPGPGLLARFRKAVAVAILLVVCSPFILFGLAANLVPYLIVRLASRRVRVPVTKGTVRMLVGVAVFPLTWIVLAVVLADGWSALVLFFAFAISGFVALWALELAVLNARTLIAWRAARGERRWFAENLREHRSTLAETVRRALDQATADQRV
jgi:1-acyl-sn-glycerol-3-phosphate acyltransferase